MPRHNPFKFLLTASALGLLLIFIINAAPRHNPFKSHLTASALGLLLIFIINAAPRHNPFKSHLTASALGLLLIFIINAAPRHNRSKFSLDRFCSRLAVYFKFGKSTSQPPPKALYKCTKAMCSSRIAFPNPICASK